MTRTQEADRVLRSVDNLPPLPAVATRLCRLAEDLDADIDEVSEVVASDQALTVRILRIANSAFFGLSREVTTVSRAIVILGFRAVSSLSLGTTLMSAQLAEQEGSVLDQEQFWIHSLAVGVASRLLAKRLRVREVEEMFVAGLVHDIGKLVFVRELPDSYQGVLARAESGEGSLHSLEKAVLGVDHPEVNLKLGEHWALPSRLVEAMTLHHAPEHASASDAPEDLIAPVVGVANGLARIVGIGDGGDPYVGDTLFSSLSNKAIDQDALREVLVELPADIQKARVFLDLGPGNQQDEEPPLRERAPVAIIVRNRAADDVLAMTLVAMGYRPVALEAIGHDEIPNLAGVICDGTEPAVLSHLCRENAVPRLDFAEWRRGNASTGDDLFNTVRLREWLSLIPEPGVLPHRKGLQE